MKVTVRLQAELRSLAHSLKIVINLYNLSFILQPVLIIIKMLLSVIELWACQASLQAIVRNGVIN